MPFTAPSLPALPPPTPQPGISSSTVVNATVGAGSFAGTNAASIGLFGADVAGVALLANVLFQGVKHFAWFDQHRWWPFALLLICVIAFVAIHHEQWVDAIWKGGAAAGQAAMNYASQKAAGLNLFESAQDP